MGLHGKKQQKTSLTTEGKDGNTGCHLGLELCRPVGQENNESLNTAHACKCRLARVGADNVADARDGVTPDVEDGPAVGVVGRGQGGHEDRRGLVDSRATGASCDVARAGGVGRTVVADQGYERPEETRLHEFLLVLGVDRNVA